MKSKQLVTIEERKWIAENATVEMGTKVKYRVMDVDKVVDRILLSRKNEAMTPYVEILPISEDLHKVPSRLPTFQKDPVTGVYYGIPIGEDDFGNPRWQKIQLQDNLSLNLDKKDDARIWAVIRFYPGLLGSPWQEQNPYYKVFDPIEKARADRNEVELMKTAFDHVDSVIKDPKAMVQFARFIGLELAENANYEIVRSKLLMEAKENPAEFIRKWDHKLRSYGEYFESARALGIIKSEPDRGFLFKGVSLGFSKEEAVKFLKNDTNVMTSISNELDEKDVVVRYVAKTLKKETESPAKVAAGDDFDID